jgi:hypothetical protein
MLEGDTCSARITDTEQCGKLFAGERLQFRVHHPSMTLFRNRSVVNIAQIGRAQMPRVPSGVSFLGLFLSGGGYCSNLNSS